jgi:UDP-hydrolysing UDP-N-acetyl-D-glucosamine 2-epimerase
MKKRKIAIVVASRANYGRVKTLMRAIACHPALELQLVVGASTLLFRFGRAVDIIEHDGFTVNRALYHVVEGDSLLTQAKTTGLGILELSTAFHDLRPDAVITVADRFETMATAIAATYQNIPLVHLQGGEVSGNIDDRVRHAITKLADIHFPCTELSRRRVIDMGEDGGCVFNLGCPSIDTLVANDLSIDNAVMSPYGGTGAVMDWTRPYILMVQHPVTTSYGRGFEEISITLEALKQFRSLQKVVLWPNLDAGTDDVSKGIRMFRERNMDEGFHYYRNFSPEDYARVLANCVCAVGNSSSFIREGAFLGTPAVSIGNRQQGREHADNIAFASNEIAQIHDSVVAQMAHGRYGSSRIFGNGDAGLRIAGQLAEMDLIQKSAAVR